MTYRKTLLAGAITALAAVPMGAVAGTAGMSTTYEQYGEQGPASYQLDLHPDTRAGAMQARSAGKMDGAKSEFSAFETVPPSRAEAAWESGRSATDLQREYPDGLRITP